jgi:hypothetical protein
MFVGDKGKILARFHGEEPQLLRENIGKAGSSRAGEHFVLRRMNENPRLKASSPVRIPAIPGFLSSADGMARRSDRMKTTIALWIVLAPGASVSNSATLDTTRIEQLTGLKGAWTAAEGVFKVCAPRNDLPVSVDGWMMPPFMGLPSN